MLKKWAFALLRPALETWLERRALNLPQAKKAELAKKFGLSLASMEEIQAEFQLYAESQVDKVLFA